MKLTRSGLFGVSAAVGASLGLAHARAALASPEGSTEANVSTAVEAFYGDHQAGIVSEQQSHSYFASFDVTATKRAELVAMLAAWTDAAASMSVGSPVKSVKSAYDDKTLVDSGEAVGLSPSRLTITFGFGPGLFESGGVDRFGLAPRRPAALVDLPRFNGDQMIEGKTGGDLSVQACADDPQVAFHAVRQLARLAGSAATIRWVQAGFQSNPAGKETPRNLMGFRDGTQTADAKAFVWAAPDSPRWMRGGTYLIARRIRIALEHWDQMNVAFQEQTIGRSKASGAPLGATHEMDALPLAATDKDGNLVIAENAHVRVANASTNDGAQILRRGYSYNDGSSMVAERWPPWRQAIEYDAGLFFMSYQRDPRTSFIPMLAKMSKIDMLNQFATHVGSGIFAIPGGVAKGEYIGQHLLEG
jgi:deferrochelatase/peroxidase EfeB